MKEKQARDYYKGILDAYSELNGDAFCIFRDDIIRLLVTPDSMYEESTGEVPPDLSPYSRN